MAITQIKSLVQFARGTSLVLMNMALPIPAGIVTFSIDDGVFKLGDGLTTYSALPTLFTYNDLISAQGGLSNMFTEPDISNNGYIAVIRFDVATNKIYYGLSDVTLASLLESITQLETENSSQNVAIADLMTAALSIDSGINTAPDNNLVTINSRRFSNSGSSISSVQTQIAAQATFEAGSHLLEPVFYVDVNKTTIVDKEMLDDNNTYYVDIKGFNNEVDEVVYSLTATNSNVVVNMINGSLFSIQLNNLTGSIKDNTPFAIIVGIDNVGGTSPMRKAVGCVAYKQRIIAAVYGGTGGDYFYGAATDSQGNIICIGYTNSEGAGITMTIIKFDIKLGISTRKQCGGSGTDQLYGVTVDSNDNIICVGNTDSEGSGLYDAFVIKFDSNLDIVRHKRYGGSGVDQFYGVTTDSQDNIICVGRTTSEGGGSIQALVIKFDSSLGIVNRKIYSGSNSDQFKAVAVDSLNNIICAGLTASEGNGGAAFVIKFNPNLDIILRKRYDGVGNDQFDGVAVDSQDNIICAGYTSSEGADTDALVVKFSASLTILYRKRYGGNSSDQFNAIVVDSQDNIICAGTTASENLGGNDAIVIKFDPSLEIITRNRFGGAGNDYFLGVATDSYDNIICAGYTTSEGSGGFEAFVLKLPSDVPIGTFTGTVLTGLTVTDSNLTLADSTLTLADSTLTLADSTLTLADSTLTPIDSTLVFEKDIFN